MGQGGTSGGCDGAEVVVLDFETSGVSPLSGDRAIEIGAVVLRGGEIVERYQSLMNPGIRISSFIENYTGITNAMVQGAPPAAQVMEAFHHFIGDRPLVAHNASFDSRFLDAELDRIRRRRRQDFACSMLAARRVYPEAPNHKLATLVRHKGLPTDGSFHRALADAEMTGHLWLRMEEDLRRAYGFRHVPFDLMRSLAAVKKVRVPAFLKERAEEQGAP
ncbi:MAG: DNA polymerase III subunit epsilon [Desulfuromonas sp.]|nr:MAG: DNA polymerase III subunit epsilon [Desulfuromonas sp.]